MDSSNQGEDSFLTKFSDTLTKFLDPKLEWAKNTWNKWDLKAIFLLSMTLQLILLILGRRRSRITKAWVRFIIWSSYLMASWIATIGIGKLSDLSVEDPYIPDTETSLKALLAPLFLLHLGSPDTITAYSIEDNQLGVREIFEAIAQIGLVIWVLFNCWTYTRLSFLAIPMFCAGLIKYGERAWSLWSALNEDVGVTTSEEEETKTIPKLLESVDVKNPNASLILKAYYRFDHLKPHLENWVHRPYYLSGDASMHLEYGESEKTFKITDIELGFMYDALYTKSPLIYSRVGFVLRFLAFIGIVLTFCGFALLFQPNFHQRDITFTYAVLLVAVCVELYSDARLLFTDRAIVWMTMQRFHDIWLLKNLVQFLAWHSKRKKRWSNRLYQFNIVRFCLKTRSRSLTTKFLGLCCLDERWEKHKFKREFNDICEDLKVSVLEKMEYFDGIRQMKPFTKCGNWSLRPHGDGGNNLREPTREIIHKTICTEFGRSVAIWHLATDICYYTATNDDHKEDTPRKMSKMLSDYMMHLLVNVPDMLSIPSGAIIFDHLRDVLTILFESASCSEKSSSSTRKVEDESWACKLLLESELPDEKEIEEQGKKQTKQPENEKKNRVAKRILQRDDPVNELRWYILPKAQELARELSKEERKWETMLSVWVEMLCYAADNCTLYSHAEQLRRGGEFITPIWLLLSHKTDRFNTATCV